MDPEDQFTEDELDALAEVTKPASVKAFREDSASESLAAAAGMVDEVIEAQPALDAPLKVYKAIDGGAFLKGKGAVTEKAFMTASTMKPEGSFVISLSIPAGARVIKFPDGAIVAKRGMKFSVPGDASAVAAATYQIEEFHGRHNQKAHGGDGGGGGMSRPSGGSSIAAEREARLAAREKRLQAQHKVEKKAERRRKLNSVVNGVVAATAVVGLLLATGVVTSRDMQAGGAKVRQGARKASENVKRRNNARNIRRTM